MKTDISTYGVKQLYWFVKSNNDLRSAFAQCKTFAELITLCENEMIYTKEQLNYLRKEWDKHNS